MVGGRGASVNDAALYKQVQHQHAMKSMVAKSRHRARIWWGHKAEGMKCLQPEASTQLPSPVATIARATLRVPCRGV